MIKKGIAYCCNYLSDALRVFKNPREAIHWYKKSISIAEDIGYVDMMMQSHVDLGETLVGLEDVLKEELEEAEEHLKVGADIARYVGNSEYVERAYGWLGQLYRGKQDWDKAMDYYTMMMANAVSEADSGVIALAYAWIGEVYRAKQDWDNAINYKMMMAEIVCLGKIKDARGFYPVMNLKTTVGLARFLCFLEEDVEKAGRKGEFAHLCDRMMGWMAEGLNVRLSQWYLEPKELSGQFTQTAFSDEFDALALCSEWQWVNPGGDCSYELNSEPSWLEIRAASGCSLLRDNLNAPRLVQEVSGDFAIETKMASADEETPTLGGLLIWKDKDNYIRFERGMYVRNDIGLLANAEGKLEYFGRGRLVSEIIYLRMERIGDTFSAYCSSDGENWLTCGQVTFPAEDPIQVGIHAIGMTGWWTGMSTAARFDYFRVLKPESQDGKP